MRDTRSGVRVRVQVQSRQLCIADAEAMVTCCRCESERTMKENSRDSMGLPNLPDQQNEAVTARQKAGEDTAMVAGYVEMGNKAVETGIYVAGRVRVREGLQSLNNVQCRQCVQNGVNSNAGSVKKAESIHTAAVDRKSVV